jgi:hypothetical protein
LHDAAHGFTLKVSEEEMRFGLMLVCCGVAATVSLAAETDPMPAMRPVPPLPQIGLPLPHIGLPAPAQPEHRRTGNPNGNSSRSHQRGARRGFPPAVVFVPAPYYVPVEAPPAVEPAPAAAYAPIPPSPPLGALLLDLQPAASVQVYVDGYYTGVTDVIGSALDLEPGAHAIELRASGYEPIAFDVRIAPDERVVYQGQLTKTPATAGRAADADSARASARPITLYVIPGCYAGNVPPDALTLAPGCDAASLTTIER